MSDFETYNDLQEYMRLLRKRYGAMAIDLPEFQAAWKAAEVIKNKHGGMPPKKK